MSAGSRAMRRLYLHDANPSDLRDRRARVEQQLRAVGALDDWDVCATPSRNVLLVSVAHDAARREPRQSVTLIDLRAETGDLEQRGFSVCRTLARVPLLRGVTRPLIWTDVHTAANLQYARTVGALGVIDDEWVDGGDDAPLVEVLRWAWAIAPTRPALTLPRVFPDDHSSIEEENRQRLERFQRWFGFTPHAPDLDYVLLWGLAEAVELKFLLEWVTEVGFATSERAARAELERLQKAMSDDVDAFDGPGPARAEVARRFLAETAPAEPSRMAELEWPRPERITQILAQHPRLREWAFNTPDDDRLLREFLERYPAPPAPPARITPEERHETIAATVDAIARADQRPIAATHEVIRLAACAVEDAFFDWRNHGEPSPLP